MPGTGFARRTLRLAEVRKQEEEQWGEKKTFLQGGGQGAAGASAALAYSRVDTAVVYRLTAPDGVGAEAGNTTCVRIHYTK